MSADKRSVSTDALVTLGTIIEDGDRDAIHLAVEPVIAGERLYPGQNIGIKNGRAYNNTDKVRSHCDRHLGIVDPFLSNPVEIDQKFWLIVYPRQITSLRHVWSHPDFEALEASVIVDMEVKQKELSEQWLRDWCEKSDVPSYERVMAAVLDKPLSDQDRDNDVSYRNEYEYIIFYGVDAHQEIPEEFWFHVEIVSGVKIVNRPEHFSCSC